MMTSLASSLEISGPKFSPSFEVLLRGVDAKRVGSNWMGRCPCHDDQEASLGLAEQNGKILVRCHAGCDQATVIDTLREQGLFPKGNGSNGESFVEHDRVPVRPNGVLRKLKDTGHTYSCHWTYRDQAGNELGHQVRYEKPGEPKESRPYFKKDAAGRWRMGAMQSPRALYGLDRLAKHPDAPVVVCEGEKAADAAGKLMPDHVAITSWGGAAGARRTDFSPLEGRSVSVWPDNDAPGQKYAEDVLEQLRKVSATIQGVVDVQTLGLPPKGDAADWPNDRTLPLPLPLIEPRSKSSTSSNPASADSPIEPPRPLRRELPPAEPFPVEALGGILGPAAQALHRGIQAPLAICGNSVLAAACLTTQALADVVIDGRQSPICEFFLSIGESGERKTAVDSEALREHRRFQQCLQEEYVQAYCTYSNQLDAYKKAREEALKKAKGYYQKQQALEDLGPPPEPPQTPLVLIQEPTFEGLVKALRHSRPSIGIFSDESGTFIGGHSLNEENRVKMGAGLSTVWDGKPLSRVRAGDGALEINGRRISTHLMAQHSVAAKFLADGVLIDQGLISRFLPCCPDSTAGVRFYNGIDLTSDPSMIAYHERVEKLLKMPVNTSATNPRELVPPALSLSAEARALYIQFYDLVEEQLAADQPLAPVRGFANKAPEHALRLAGVLSVFDNPETKKIDLEHMANGIELVQFYLSEALRLFHSGRCNPSLIRAEKLLAWAQGFTFIHLRQIYQFGPNCIREAAQAKEAARILVEHGWLRPVADGLVLDGAKRRLVWEVEKCSVA